MPKNFRFLKRKRVILSFILILIAIGTAWFFYIRDTQVLPQVAIYFLNEISSAQKGQKVLVFSPHPDDETIAAGGYIADAQKNGAHIKIILVTNGNKHHLEQKRYGEFKKATDTLGVKEEGLVFFNFKDGKLAQENKDTLKELFKKEIDSFKPDIIIYPHPYDGHPDHATTGKIVKEILKTESEKPIALQYLVHHHRFPQPKKYDPGLYLLPPVSFISFDQNWQRYMVSDPAREQKKRAVFNYTTQLRVPILRGLILSMIRKNELFAINQQ